MCGSSPTHNSAPGITRPGLTAPILASQEPAAPWITPTDVQVAALVLAGQAADYAIHPGPAEALADVLEMTGLTVERGPAAWRHSRRRAAS